MGHNLDTTEGQTSFVSARTDAWHHLGTTLPGAFTAEEAMEAGLLGGWQVRKAPIVAIAEDGVTLPMAGRYAVLRTNPVLGTPEVIGNVGEAYHVIQNEDHAGLLNALIDESGSVFDTAGALDGGRRVFITMKMPGHMLIGGVDRVDNYIVAVTSHDGSMAFTLMVTPIRVASQTTLNLAFGRASNTVRVRHTSGAKRILVQEARDALDLTFDYLEGFQEQAERMLATTLTRSRFEELISREFGARKGAAPATVTRTDHKLDQMAALFSDAATQDGIRGTAWAGLNALTEWADHYAPTRGDERDTSRAENAVLSPGFKNRALALMLKEVH